MLRGDLGAAVVDGGLESSAAQGKAKANDWVAKEQGGGTSYLGMALVVVLALVAAATGVAHKRAASAGPAGGGYDVIA
jgi:hypothetical protein